MGACKKHIHTHALFVLSVCVNVVLSHVAEGKKS